jgi:hypothetical protein
MFTFTLNRILPRADLFVHNWNAVVTDERWEVIAKTLGSGQGGNISQHKAAKPRVCRPQYQWR